MDFNILEKVKSGMVQDVCTISVTHSRPTLSTKDLQYGKVHENREIVSGAEIPSKLNFTGSDVKKGTREYFKPYSEFHKTILKLPMVEKFDSDHYVN